MYVTNEEIRIRQIEITIATELKRLNDHEITHEYRRVGSKHFAVVKLTNGKKLMVCPYRRRVTYLNKTYKYKYLERFIDNNNLEVSYK